MSAAGHFAQHTSTARRIGFHVRPLAWIALACVAGIAGCSWFGKDEKPPAPLPDFKATAPARVQWQQPLESAGQPGFTPVGTGDTVYVATPEGTIASFNGATGSPNWRVKAGSKLSAGIGASGANGGAKTPRQAGAPPASAALLAAAARGPRGRNAARGEAAARARGPRRSGSSR